MTNQFNNININLSNESLVSLDSISNMLRKKVLEMCFKHGGHISTSFSCVELLTTLYFTDILNVDPKKLNAPERDKFILSKGHGETILYAVLAKRGFFPERWLDENYRSNNCFLGGHVDSNVPGVEVTTGALGHGLGLGCGLAYASKIDKENSYTYVMLGDAECSEGSIWEAALFASQHSLGNLVAIIDNNEIGSLDFTKNYISLEPFTQKWKSFGWRVIELDGHNHKIIYSTLKENKIKDSNTPLVVIAKTVKGKGVKIFENDPIWHVKPVTEESYQKGIIELDKRVI